MSLFHDTLAGQKTLFLSSHHCQKSTQLHLEGEETVHWNVKIRLHDTELSLERCGEKKKNLAQTGAVLSMHALLWKQEPKCHSGGCPTLA